MIDEELEVLLDQLENAPDDERLNWRVFCNLPWSIEDPLRQRASELIKPPYPAQMKWTAATTVGDCFQNTVDNMGTDQRGFQGVPGYEGSRGSFEMEDVQELIAFVEGATEGPSSIAVGRLYDGRWFYRAIQWTRVSNSLHDLLSCHVGDDSLGAMRVDVGALREQLRKERSRTDTLLASRLKGLE